MDPNPNTVRPARGKARGRPVLHPGQAGQVPQGPIPRSLHIQTSTQPTQVPMQPGGGGMQRPPRQMPPRPAAAGPQLRAPRPGAPSKQPSSDASKVRLEQYYD